MITKKQRIGVLMGGLSSEREVSLKSGGAVSQALRERGWNVVDIVVDRDLPTQLLENKVDVAWIALHGRFGEDGAVQGLLEVMGIPYTGSAVRASAVAMDKVATKRAVADASVVMAKDWVWHEGEPLPADLELPVVVKPAVGGSTIGISIANTREELEVALESALSLHDELLIEAFVEGEEITVAVLDGEAFPVVRIVPDSGFFDYEAKYTKGTTTYEVPGDIPDAAAQSASAQAVAAFHAIGCRGLARADFIVPSSGDPVFLEINTIPGMTATSLSPMAAGARGISFPELVEKVLLGATRMEAEGKPEADDVTEEALA